MYGLAFARKSDEDCLNKTSFLGAQITLDKGYRTFNNNIKSTSIVAESGFGELF